MSTEQVASESSSDSGSRIPQPICAVVTPPMVTSTSREALIAWLKLRDEYVEGTKERCKAAKEGLNAVLKSVKNSLDSYLLTTLCEATWGISKSDLTDEFLLEQIHASPTTT
ncbi:Cleavage induced protein [Phytophthora cinnamomi]|uniref:Cleavage induced protein n=1 Tax=Phytophthora cinnamomi TaxID=4785 RepID=UPI00355A52A5|nr:Cleavage induced protein [Phytophthora cinnamomi]